MYVLLFYIFHIHCTPLALTLCFVFVCVWCVVTVTAFAVSDGFGAHDASSSTSTSSGVTATVKGLLSAGFHTVVDKIFGDSNGKFMKAYVSDLVQHRFWTRDVSKIVA